MWFFVWIILGASIGWLYSFLTKAHPRTESPMSFYAGISGAMVGCFVSYAMGYEAFTIFSLGAALITQIIAIVFVLIVNIFKIGAKKLKKE